MYKPNELRMLSKATMNVNSHAFTKLPLSKRSGFKPKPWKLIINSGGKQRRLKNENDNHKNVSLIGMLFSKLTVFTIVRDTKDVLLVTTCGAEAIPFMKTWFNFPLSILSIMYFSYLVNKGLDNKWIYRCTYIPIALLYSFVGLVLYPNRAFIQPTFALTQSYIHPVFVSIANNWVSAIFYSLSSIWGSTVISLLFWMIANEYTDVEKAKEVYPLYGFLANFALVFAGLIMTKISTMFAHDWEMNMRILMCCVSVFSVVSYGFFEYLVNRFEPINMNYQKKEKKKMSLFEGFMSMWNEPFIKNMVLIIASYGSCIALYETYWKQYMQMYFDSPVAYSNFMGTVSYIKGLTTMVLMIVSSFTMKKMKFVDSLMVTPLAISSIGILFFTAIILNMDTKIIVYFGAFMGVCTKALKYAFFDPNKEIAYIPMSNEIKTKGKATVDVISNPLGKSGSSLVLQGMIIMCGSLMEALPMIALYFVIVCCVWLYVIQDLTSNVDLTCITIKH